MKKLFLTLKDTLFSPTRKKLKFKKLSHVQLIVEFYFWLAGLDKRFEVI